MNLSKLNTNTPQSHSINVYSDKYEKYSVAEKRIDTLEFYIELLVIFIKYVTHAQTKITHESKLKLVSTHCCLVRLYSTSPIEYRTGTLHMGFLLYNQWNENHLFHRELFTCVWPVIRFGWFDNCWVLSVDVDSGNDIVHWNFARIPAQ